MAKKEAPKKSKLTLDMELPNRQPITDVLDEVDLIPSSTQTNYLKMIYNQLLRIEYLQRGLPPEVLDKEGMTPTKIRNHIIDSTVIKFSGHKNEDGSRILPKDIQDGVVDHD